MNKRELTEETKNKILKCAAEILMMHAEVAGNRICQDWSGEDKTNPNNMFTEKELDDLSFNYELYNSDGRYYDKDYNGLGDEMVASFCMGTMLNDMAT
jgi:hypothetical protein